MSIKSPPDTLLTVARIVLAITMGFMGLGIGAAAFALPVLLYKRTDVLAQLAAEGAPGEALWALCILLVLVAAACALGFLFFRNLYRIVGTVGEGDPFVPANARRLSGMGMIVLAVHVLAIPLFGVLRWLESVTEHVHSNASFGLDGLLLALVLFILARVFREGTRMRDELEGTV